MAIALGSLSAIASCESAREAPRVERPIVVDGSHVVEVTTDLGFEINLSEARLALADLEFTTAGELHSARLTPGISRFFVASAHAHPGHYEGGEIIGEAKGRFLVDWFEGDEAELATATLIASEYTSANFTFARGDDELDSQDLLSGHTAVLGGVARRDGFELAFTFVVDSPEDRLLVGAPFEATIIENEDGEILFRLEPRDELGTSTLFDSVDFESLDADGDGEVLIDPASTEDAEIDAYNQLKRRLQTHNHYAFVYRPLAGGPGGSP
jgi:hypothetical protein